MHVTIEKFELYFEDDDCVRFERASKRRLGLSNWRRYSEQMNISSVSNLFSMRITFFCEAIHRSAKFLQTDTDRSIIPAGENLVPSVCSAALLIATGTASPMQTFIKDEMTDWKLESARTGLKHASQKAALSILHIIKIETEDSYRAAAFSADSKSGSPQAMQAVGLVNVQVTHAL